MCHMGSNARERSRLSDAVADEIRAERARSRKLQAEVAEAAGLSLATYIRIEQGARVIDVSQLRRVAEVFGMSAGDILARAEANVNAEQAEDESPEPVEPQRHRKRGVVAKVALRKPTREPSQVTDRQSC